VLRMQRRPPSAAPLRLSDPGQRALGVTPSGVSFKLEIVEWCFSPVSSLKGSSSVPRSNSFGALVVEEIKQV